MHIKKPWNLLVGLVFTVSVACIPPEPVGDDDDNDNNDSTTSSAVSTSGSSTSGHGTSFRSSSSRTSSSGMSSSSQSVATSSSSVASSTVTSSSHGVSSGATSGGTSSATSAEPSSTSSAGSTTTSALPRSSSATLSSSSSGTLSGASSSISAGSSSSAGPCSSDPECDDLNACTVDTCNGNTCSRAAVVVEDSVDCTVDSCDPSTGILHQPDHTACPETHYCDVLAGCQPRQDKLPVITEFVAMGTAGNEGELVELYNPGTTEVPLTGYLLKNAAGEVAALRSAADPDGTSSTPVILPPLGRVWGVANPADDALIPADADFVWGLPGTTWNLDDTGDVLSLLDLQMGVVDSVDFTSVAVDPSVPVLPGQFPLLPGISTQLDRGYGEDPASNDDGNRWCTTFRAAHTAGAPNGSCQEVVINEIHYDPDSPSGDGDEGLAFIELAGPGGAVLAGMTLVGLDGDGVTEQTPNLTFVETTRMPLDGLFVLADADGAGTTKVREADLVMGDADPQNGDGNGDAVQLRLPGGAVLDTVGYGASVLKEGTAAPDINPDKVGLSLARSLLSTDTNNNAADFHPDPTPSPGVPNLPVNPVVHQIKPADAPAVTVGGATTLVVLVVEDFADLATVNGVTQNDNDIDATFMDVATTDTSALTDGCTILATSSTPGRMNMVCRAPNRSSGAARGDFILRNPAAIGGQAVLTQGWTYTASRNETDTPEEADACLLHDAPASLTVKGGALTAAILARVTEAELTPLPGSSSSIRMQIGWGPFQSNPMNQPGWFFFDASFNAQVGDEDEYTLQLTAPTPLDPTSYAYAARVSFDDGMTFTYCDRDGAGSNPSLSFSASQLGVLEVNP